MEVSDTSIYQVQRLRQQLEEKDAKLRNLEAQLRRQQHNIQLNKPLPEPSKNGLPVEIHSAERPHYPLLTTEYQRYGRQMILSEIGLPGQLKLKASKVLIVGVGGLGCPAAAYLAGAGVGTLGLIDGDNVEISNLHRQILHHTNGVDRYKVDSAVESLYQLNPHVNYIPIRENLTSCLSASIFPSYDLILDCTDRPSTRYLVSDGAVLTGKPLVTASAVKTEGQLIVLNNPPRAPGDEAGSPCYRCIFPRPPPPETVTSCADGGILGPVVGTMGILQALEAIKVLTAVTPLESQPTSMLVFSAYSSQQFRNIIFRRRKRKCWTCGEKPEVTLEMFKTESLRYEALCGVVSPVNLLTPSERISAEEYDNRRNEPHVLVDTREKTQFEICHLDGSINVPMEDLRNLGEKREWLDGLKRDRPIYFVCRLGNDSQEAVKLLKRESLEGTSSIMDIRGGLRAWRETIDPEFPDY